MVLAVPFLTVLLALVGMAELPVRATSGLTETRMAKVEVVQQ
jgi:hypothetical protein